MEDWISCPKCGKPIKLFKVRGKVRIEGGTLEQKCRLCKSLIEIYDDCKTRVSTL